MLELIFLGLSPLHAHFLIASLSPCSSSLAIIKSFSKSKGELGEQEEKKDIIFFIPVCWDAVKNRCSFFSEKDLCLAMIRMGGNIFPVKPALIVE